MWTIVQRNRRSPWPSQHVSHTNLCKGRPPIPSFGSRLEPARCNMKLATLIDSYISFKRNVGMRFNAENRALRAFSKALGDVDITEVERKQVLRYINGQGPVTFFWHRKYEALTGFYRFAIARGYIAESPLPTVIPKRPKAFVPYIYSSEEMR